jgi:hypothetical protein
MILYRERLGSGSSDCDCREADCRGPALLLGQSWLGAVGFE